MISMITPTRSVDQMLDTLPRRDLLGLVAFIDARQARDALLKTFVLDRLRRAPRSSGQDHPDELLTVPEVAARLKLSKPRIYELVKSGRLSTVRFGKQIRIPARALDTSPS